MEIFETLRIEHAAIKNQLEDVIGQTSKGMTGDSRDDAHLSEVVADRDWPKALHELKISLIAHDRAEEAVFYELLRQVPHRAELAEIKTEEHQLTEAIFAQLETIKPGSRVWDETLSLLKNQLESHIAEEETMVFAILQAAVSDEDSNELSLEFERQRDMIAGGFATTPLVTRNKTSPQNRIVPR